jgi:hypothetical protein
MQAESARLGPEYHKMVSKASEGSSQAIQKIHLIAKQNSRQQKARI